jgi:hypothetical protein
MSSRTNCAACGRNIDAFAKLCPYCGANPVTGERVDTQALLQEMFSSREMTTSASVLEYARQRQGVVIGVAALVAFLVIAGLHQFVTMRNATAVTDAPAVPLSEITDVTTRPEDTAPVPLPELNFQYDGRPQTMRTYIMENGATTPPEVVAAQQAEAAAKAAAAQPPAGAAVRPPGAPGAAPGAPAAQPQAARPPAMPQRVPPAQQPARPVAQPR